MGSASEKCRVLACAVLGDQRVVTFEANCIVDSSNALVTDDLGSIFLWREDQGTRFFVKNNSPAPRLDHCDTCSSDRYVTFADNAARPAGVFTANSNPQRP